MNDKEFYKLKTYLRKARDKLAPIKAEKLELRHDRWELKDFTLTKQFDKLMEEEIEEFRQAYFNFRKRPIGLEADKILEEIADCQNMLDGIAYLVLKEV